MHAPPMNVGVENGYGQLVVELGIAGLLLWILLAYAIARSAWRAAKNLKGTVWFPIGFAIFLYAFLLVFPMSFYGFIAYQDFVMNTYFWLMLVVGSCESSPTEEIAKASRSCALARLLARNQLSGC